MVQGPAKLEVTSKEALLKFPSSSPSPSRQRREGAGLAREEQLQRRPSSSWEQEGPSSCGGAVGRDGRDQGCISLHGTPASCPQCPAYSQTMMRLREIFWEPSLF